MSQTGSIVAGVMQQSRQSCTVLDRPQKMPKGHMSSDGTTANGTSSWWPATERRWRLSNRNVFGWLDIVSRLNMSDPAEEAEMAITLLFYMCEYSRWLALLKHRN